MDYIGFARGEMMKLDYSKQELTDFLEITGSEVFWFERLETKQNHFLIDIIGDETKYADDREYFTILELQIQFATKDAQSKLSKNKFMKSNFNCNLTTSYSDNSGWYYAIYNVKLRIADYVS